MLALDWLNGNRSVLVDHHLSGVVAGLTLATRAPDLYRALIESTAFGTRMIVNAFEDAGISVRELVIASGLLRNKFIRPRLQRSPASPPCPARPGPRRAPRPRPGPLLTLTNIKIMTLPVGLSQVSSASGIMDAEIMAPAALGALLVFLLAQRQIVEGIATTGIK